MTVEKRDAVIFGTTAFAEVAQVYLTEDSPYRVRAFTVHREFVDRDRIAGIDVIPFEDLATFFPPDRCEMLVALGYSAVNRNRQAMYELCKGSGYRLLTYVSSRVSHVAHYEIGDNCFVFENNVIQPFVKIGNNVVLWSGNHIGHHSTIGNHVFMASHAVVSGHCEIGDRCFIGVNATLRDGLTVAEECVIGAGSLILKNTKPGEVYRGTRTLPMEGMSSTRLQSI